MINPKDSDEDCFKWAITTTLHHKEIEHHPERISFPEHYGDQYNLRGFDFPLAMQKKPGKFEKNNPGMVIVQELIPSFGFPREIKHNMSF